MNIDPVLKQYISY